MSLPTTFNTELDKMVPGRSKRNSASSATDSPTKKNEDNMIFGVNHEPLIGSILKSNNPPTETLETDDEGPDFVVPKRRNRRPSRVSVNLQF
jgi:hypothetical protein